MLKYISIGAILILAYVSGAYADNQLSGEDKLYFQSLQTRQPTDIGLGAPIHPWPSGSSNVYMMSPSKPVANLSPAALQNECRGKAEKGQFYNFVEYYNCFIPRVLSIYRAQKNPRLGQYEEGYKKIIDLALKFDDGEISREEFNKKRDEISTRMNR